MYLFRYVLCIATKKHGRERIKIRGRAFYYNAYIYYTTLLSIVNYFGATFFLFLLHFILLFQTSSQFATQTKNREQSFSVLAEVEGVEPPRRYERPLSFQD